MSAARYATIISRLAMAVLLMPLLLLLLLSSSVSAFQSLHLAPTTTRRRCLSLWPQMIMLPTNEIITMACPTQQQRRRQLTSLRTRTSVYDDDTSESENNNFTYTTLDEIIIPTDIIDTVSSSSTFTTSRNLQHVLHTIEHAAYTAGQIALSTAGQIPIQSTKANIRDLVTESDVKCQQLIRDIIVTEFPNDLFLGEEDVDLKSCCQDSSGASRAALEEVLLSGKSGGTRLGSGEEDRLLFIVDPIDGTTNFQAGLPLYAVSIGVVLLPSSSSSLSSSPEAVAGVIYNPRLGEMTSAVKGRGCYLNNRRLNPPQNHHHHPSQQQQQQQHLPPRTSILNQSLINVGFPISKESTLHVSSKAVSALATKVRGLRMVACASQAMAWVAQSKFNAYFSWDLNGWDVAAGIVIVEESGGLVSKMEEGGARADVGCRDMIITCPCERRGEEGLLRDELIEVLKENDCFDY